MDEILCVSPSLADAFLGATAFRLCLFSSPTSKAWPTERRLLLRNHFSGVHGETQAQVIEELFEENWAGAIWCHSWYVRTLRENEQQLRRDIRSPQSGLNLREQIFPWHCLLRN